MKQELKKVDETMDFKTAKKLFKLLPSKMKMQLFISSGSYPKCTAIDIQAMNINPIQALFFLAGIDAECEVRVIVYDNSFDFALAYNSVFNVESTTHVEYTYEQKEMMLSAEHEKQFLTNSI